MGSGAGGNYEGGNSGSQPYAPSYHVEKSMHDKDIKNGVFHNGHYDKNPTAENLKDKIVGNYIGSKKDSYKIPYVIDMKGNIIIGKRNGNGRGDGAKATPHPTLVGGRDPVVKMAGILEIRGGKIFKYDNKSGHFKPNSKSMTVADEIFGKLDKKLFHRQFRR